MKAEFDHYLLKHKTEPFIMLDEMDLTYDEFIKKMNDNWTFRKMWELNCNFNYYDIRAGKCEYAKIIHGKIYCELKNCQ
jgi:hypothetical protein